MGILKAAVAVLVSIFAMPVQADPDRVSILLGSRHLGAGGFNEVNPGIFVTWENDRIDWSIGAYVNSYGRGSIAATGALSIMQWQDGEASLFGGVAYYPDAAQYVSVHAGNLVPIAGLQIRHGYTFAQIMPLDGDPVDAIVTFGLTFTVGTKR